MINGAFHLEYATNWTYQPAVQHGILPLNTN